MKSSLDLVEAGGRWGLTFRKLDYWCHQGIFGVANRAPGNGQRRTFSDEDLHIAMVLARVSQVVDRWTGGRGGFVTLYTDLAVAIRAQRSSLIVVGGNGIELHIDLDKLDLDAQEHDLDAQEHDHG